MTLYSAMLSKEVGVHVPNYLQGLSTRRLLTMSWLDGDPLLDFADSSLEVRNAIAKNMFHAWYVPFYCFGVIHGDPHLGNYSVRRDYTINLWDFGCIRVFDAEFVGGVIDLYYALRDGDVERAVYAYETWGFSNISNDLMDVLNIWANFVYAPLLKDQVQKIQETNNGLYGAAIANKVHKELRRLGGVQPPREFVFMDRAAIGLGSVFMHLKAEINWHNLFHSLIEHFDVAETEIRQQRALKDQHLL